jgi:type II secretory ATPase GspE/PulE/Tfp pilus assembly ATPase PilB-like protein
VTFSSILRHFLRHDPDVIMIGEIRDEETARMAIQASLTGHLVLTTLHTHDSVSAISRLIDLGVEPYLAASSLRAILAQRLVPAKKGGRLSLVEFLEVTEPVRSLITGVDPESHIRRYLKQTHFKWLKDRASEKVTSGLVKAAEVERYLE